MKRVIILFYLVSFLFAGRAIAQPPASQQFDGGGTYTYTINTGYSALVTIEAWGAGAGGGSGAAERGGGGGGAYASLTTTLTAGSYTVTVGTGGTVGNPGGNSSFTTIVVAAGGSSTSTVTGGAGGTVAASTGTIRFAGGAGGNGGNNNSGGGGGGGSATPTAAGGNGGTGTNGNNAAGGAGGTGQGAGGAGSTNTNGASAGAGTVPGGGGGGRASNTTTSAVGAAGRVIVTVNTVLPVKLSDVKAFVKGTGVQVEWTNLTEKDVVNYIVERSANGHDFTSLSQLSSRSNQSDKQSYLSIDGAPLSGTNYYRIKVLEIDGKITYSKLLKVVIGRIIKGIVLYPNPVAVDAVSISFTADKGQYTLQVLNSAGQQVYSKGLAHPGGSISQSVELPLTLKSGVYNMVISGESYRENKMFIKQ